jgi:hypothetical protein
MGYLEVKFSDELPPEKVVVFFADKKGNKTSGARYGEYMDQKSAFHPIEWFDYWLKENNG